MSTSLIVLLPVMLLGIVGMLCFAGCILPAYEAAPPYTEYTGKTVLLNPAIIAYWPLREAADTDPASELISDNKGSYIDSTTAPSLYPWLAYSVGNPPGPDILSADAPGAIAFGQPGIVKGDAVQPANDPAIVTPCVVVNGGYVDVPFNVKFIPLTSFTIEAWVRVDWSAKATHANRFVLDSRDINPGTGFALFARAEEDQPGVYSWAGMIGNGGTSAAGFTIVGIADPAITLSGTERPGGTTCYLALSYDGPSQTLTLYVNGAQLDKVTSAVYMPNSTQPLWIGAGAPYVPRRPQPADVVASPLFPFVGAIQDVAIYSAALSSDVILRHFHNGNGTDPNG
ncbi:LamG domain-containing protein [Bradyrhizobium sp.]|uniref:LamG domain-containing protein n=1 Tax=Bradyrhizobium sp. TaxID=376 RepID=UPI002E072BFD|nr:LamG domain-containing protein [Bradyrhizobium sp.]